MKKKIIVGAVILIVAAIVLWATVLKNNKNNFFGYKKEAVDRGNIEALVDTTGTLNPVIIVDVGSQVSGKIKNLYVDFNSVVKRDQLIAEIDPEQFVTRVDQNKANYQSSLASLEKSKVTLQNSKRKYERALDLFKKNLISYEEKETAETTYYSAKADLQSTEARLAQAKSQLDSSRVDLQYTIIKSPIDGVVINRNINVGQTVAASFQAPVLFQIANDLSKMQVECSVDEADIGRVKEGQRVTFTVDAFPNENFQGIVSQVRYSPEVVSNVVTYTTIVEVDNPELKLRPGMTATISIVVGEAKNALRVPNSALRFTPQLSIEEMKQIFEDMSKEKQAKRSTSANAQEQDSERKMRKASNFGRQFGEGMDQQSSRMSSMPRVWIEDEKGKLKMIFIKIGVTDNVLTEIVRGDLKEDQLVITGEVSGKQEDSSSYNRRPGGMFMIRK